MTDNDEWRIEIDEYVIRSDGTVMRWMSADAFLDRLAMEELDNDPSLKRYDVFKRMMEAI